MAFKTCRFFGKDNNASSILNLSNSTFSSIFFLLKDFYELSKPPVLFEHLIFARSATFTTLFITKYTEKNL